MGKTGRSSHSAPTVDERRKTRAVRAGDSADSGADGVLTLPLRLIAKQLGMGTTNVVSGFLVPLALVIAWGFAIYGSWAFDAGQDDEGDGTASRVVEAEPPQGDVAPDGEDESP